MLYVKVKPAGLSRIVCKTPTNIKHKKNITVNIKSKDYGIY